MICWNSGQGLGGLGFRVEGLGFGVTKHPLETHSRNPKEEVVSDLCTKPATARSLTGDCLPNLLHSVWTGHNQSVQRRLNKWNRVFFGGGFL